MPDSTVRVIQSAPVPQRIAAQQATETITLLSFAIPVVAVKIIAENIIGGFTLPLVLDGMRITADGFLQLWNSDQNKYHTILVQGDAGAEYMTIGAGET